MATKTAPKKAEEAEAAPPKKGGKMKKMIMLIGGVILLGGGGAGAALWATGWPAGEHGAEDPNQPHLVPKDEASAEEVAVAKRAAHEGHIDPHVFKATYFALPQPFTSNLRGGDSFVQMGLGVSTFYDERVIDRVKEHDMAIRSAILMTLSQQDPLVIATPEGKEALRQTLRNAVNAVLTSKEGFGGIEEVYFTTFVTQ
jgi:flagellar protein FliL